MPDWRLKAYAQRGLSALPASHRWNRLFQTYVTRNLAVTTEGAEEKRDWVLRHLEAYRSTTGMSAGDASILEVGTGWFPVTSVFLGLSGARVVTFDIRSHLTEQYVRDTLVACRSALLRASDSDRYHPSISQLDRALELPDGAPVAALLDAVGVEAVVGDLADGLVQADSIDLVTSDSTLEHVPPDDIDAMFRQLGRIVRPSGMMSHHIDLADHFTTFDSSITVYNFLQYSEERWKRYDSSLNHQNRLRITDYRRLHDDAGWRIVGEQVTRKPDTELDGLDLDEAYGTVSRSDLLVHSAWIQSVPGGASR